MSDELHFVKRVRPPEVHYPFQMLINSLKKKGIKRAELPPVEIEKAILRFPWRRCLVQKQPAREPTDRYLLSVYFAIEEGEIPTFSGGWIRFLVKPDSRFGAVFFALDASLDRQSPRGYDEFLLEIKLLDQPVALVGVALAAYAELDRRLEALPFAERLDLTTPSEFQTLWRNYISAMKELAKRQTLFFRVEAVSGDREDLKDHSVWRDVTFSWEDFLRDNIESGSTVMEASDLAPENGRELFTKLWGTIRHQQFEILDLEAKQALQALMKTDRDSKREAQVRLYGTARHLDLKERTIQFKEGDEDDQVVQVPAAGDYLVPRMAGQLSLIRRMERAFQQLVSGNLHNRALQKCMFDASAARPASLPSPISDDMAQIRANLLQKDINDEQLRAVLKAVYAPDIALIQGPPGTGKTTVVAEIVHQVLRLSSSARILISSQSHLAVDNALTKLRGDPAMVPVRVAVSAEARGSLEPEGRQFLLDRIDLWVERGDIAGEAKDNVVWNTFLHRLGGLDLRGPGGEVLRRFRNRGQNELTTVDRELLRDHYVRGVNVVAATCAECGRTDFHTTWAGERGFDLVVIDEVSKVTPPELFVPVVHARRVVLIGDHRQLPPMIEEDLIEQRLADLGARDIEEKLEEMKESLFERLFHGADSSLKETLRTQYRMHPQIQRVVDQFYQQEGGLQCGLPEGAPDRPDLADPQSRYHGLRFSPLLQPENHAMWVDTDGVERRDGTSYFNDEEVRVVLDVLRLLTAADGWGAFENHPAVDREIGIITFYGAQATKIRSEITVDEALKSLKPRVRTVDRFQGMEKDIVIVSLVRSGQAAAEGGGTRRSRKVGFARDYRRINVGLSRARRLLVIVGSQKHFSSEAAQEAAVYYRGVRDVIRSVDGDLHADQLESALHARTNP